MIIFRTFFIKVYLYHVRFDGVRLLKQSNQMRIYYISDLLALLSQLSEFDLSLIGNLISQYNI